jgi:F-type H+-transporting ATPase subunit epsilon
MSLPQHLFIEIATPEKHLAGERAEWIHIPTLKGYIGILPGHVPLVTILGTGELTFKTEKGEKSLFVSGGFVEVLPTWVRIIAEIGERIEEIEEERALAEKERAERIIKNEKGEYTQEEIKIAIHSLKKAEERLRMISKRKGKL